METLRIMLTIVTVLMVIFSVSGLLRDRERLREYCEAGMRNNLIIMMDEKKGWIERHIICSVMGMLCIAVIRYIPTLEEFDMLAGFTAVYVALSLLFAFIESLFVQRISHAISARANAIETKNR